MARGKISLAQNDSVSQAFVEVGADGGTGDLLDPGPQLLLGLGVIFLRDLDTTQGKDGVRGRRCRVGRGEHKGTMWCVAYSSRQKVHKTQAVTVLQIA